MVKEVKKIVTKGYPVNSKKYAAAHELADKMEKKKYPKGYEVLKKAVRKNAGTDELLATHTKSGKIEVEKKFDKFKNELAYHEMIERKAMARKKKR